MPGEGGKGEEPVRRRGERGEGVSTGTELQVGRKELFSCLGKRR